MFKSERARQPSVASRPLSFRSMSSPHQPGGRKDLPPVCYQSKISLYLSQNKPGSSRFVRIYKQVQTGECLNHSPVLLDYFYGAVGSFDQKS